MPMIGHLIVDQPVFTGKGIVLKSCPLKRQMKRQVFNKRQDVYNNKTAVSLIIFILKHNEIVWKEQMVQNLNTISAIRFHSIPTKSKQKKTETEQVDSAGQRSKSRTANAGN